MVVSPDQKRVTFLFFFFLQISLSLTAIKRIAEHHIESGVEEPTASESWDLLQRSHLLREALNRLEEHRLESTNDDTQGEREGDAQEEREDDAQEEREGDASHS